MGLMIALILFYLLLLPLMSWVGSIAFDKKIHWFKIYSVITLFSLFILSLVIGNFDLFILIFIPGIFLLYYYAYHKDKLHWFKDIVDITGILYSVIAIIVPYNTAIHSGLYGLIIPIGIGLFLAGLYRHIIIYLILPVLATLVVGYIIEKARITLPPYLNPTLLLLLMALIIATIKYLFSEKEEPLYKKTEEKIKEDLKKDNYRVPSDIFFDYINKKLDEKLAEKENKK